MAVRAREAYRRIVIPVSSGGRCDAAIAIACRLAADRGVKLTVVSAVEVPPHLPLDSHMQSEDEAARHVLAEARAVAALYGLDASTRVVRTRAAAEAIVSCAIESDAQLVVVGAPRRRGKGAPVFGRTVGGVLAHAPCRVLVTAL